MNMMRSRRKTGDHNEVQNSKQVNLMRSTGGVRKKYRRRKAVQVNMRRSTGGASEHDEVEKSNPTRSKYHIVERDEFERRAR